MARPETDHSHAIPSLLSAWGLKNTSFSAHRIPGGELHHVYRVETGDRAFALRILDGEVSPEDAESAAAHVERLSESVPEVPRPIRSLRGALHARSQGYTATLSPYVYGKHPDPSDRVWLTNAAEVLARVHSASLAWGGVAPRPGFPRWESLNWREGGTFDWPLLANHLGTVSSLSRATRRDLRIRVESGLASASSALASLAGGQLKTTLVHGDYWVGNIIVRGSRIAGIVDWDDVRIDWRMWDVACGAKESGTDPSDPSFDPSLAARFVDSYRQSGGELTEDELASLFVLMQARMLWEVMYEIRESYLGYVTDWDYIQANLRIAGELTP